MAAMFLWATFAGVQFGTYEKLRSMDPLRANDTPPSPAVTGIAGGGGGAGTARDTRGEGVAEVHVSGGAGGVKGGEERRGGLPAALSHFVFGAIAGSAATVTSYPFDITRTALAYQVRMSLRERGLRVGVGGFWGFEDRRLGVNYVLL